MKAERWQQIAEVLDEALKQPEAERAAFLDAACGEDAELRREVESLMQADEDAGAFLGSPLLEDGEAGDRGDWAGRRIGPYRLIHKIGEGGMSTVYLAIRDDDQYQRRAAIKLLRRGVGSESQLQRFRTERQILASLDHPNIGRLFDGGTTEEGVAYFVMEYIEGEPIDEYCDRHALPVAERVELFRTVCSAVHYAHQNLVVHRDLKPGNILVTEQGIPKLLDFGIAKLLNPDLAAPGSEPTVTWQRVLTPEYASPEQVQGKPITTASDVYSLGVLLYRLLTGRLPHHFSNRTPREIERVLLNVEPDKPSTASSRVEESSRSPVVGAPPAELRRLLSGDLDNIVSLAMRKEPQRRYGSAELLSEDLRRHLQGLPVTAHPDSFGYQTGKFLRRHRGAVAAVLAFVAFAIGSAVTLALQSTRIKEERDQARLERDKSRQALSFIEGIFKSADPGEARGEDLSARKLAERGAERVLEELGEQPAVQASILNSLGNIHRNLGLYERADELLRTALENRREALGNEHGDVAESLNDLSLLLMDQSKFAEAEPLLHEALEIRTRALGEEHSETAETVNNLGLIESYQGRFDSAETYLRRGLELNRKAFGNEHGHVALSLGNLAVTLTQKGEHAQAEEALLEALAVQRKVFGNEHPELGGTLANLSHVYRAQGKLEQAEEVLHEALAMQRKLVGEEHLNVAVLLNSLGKVMQEKSDYVAAEQHLSAALAMWERLFGKENPRSATIRSNLASAVHAKGDVVAAEALYRETLGVFERTAPENHPHVAIASQGLGRLLLENGRLEEALPLLERSLTIAEQALPEGHEIRETGQRLLAECRAGLNPGLNPNS